MTASSMGSNGDPPRGTSFATVGGGEAWRGARVARMGLLAAGLVVFGLAFLRDAARPPAADFLVPTVAVRAAGSDEPAWSRTADVSHGVTPFAHCPAAIEVPGRGLVAFWYGGAREGARDAAIYTSVLEQSTGSWSREEIVIGRDALQEALHRAIRTIGNPTAIVERDGHVWLFLVSVSLGGWSGSAVTVMRSADGGRTWEAPRRLVTSPVLNLATLVKGAPFLYADGSIGLPVYHELIGKFGTLLRLDRDGRVLAQRRLRAAQPALQPVVAPRTGAAASGFMRPAGAPARILAFDSDDAGRSWSDARPSSLPNPNAGIDVLRLDDGALLLAFNDSESARDNLSLAYRSDEGRTWRVARVVERTGAPGSEHAYPWLLRAADGRLHLFYSVDKQRIEEVSFNRAWLMERLP